MEKYSGLEIWRQLRKTLASARAVGAEVQGEKWREELGIRV